MKQQANTAAIYLRLSRDDGGDAESNSIGNQREMLRRFAKDNNMKVFSEYVDDGISGTTFERQQFKRMIDDIENDKIGIVLCKDLSRLDRNNAMVAYYTEIFFPQNDIRFIALNDNIDTLYGENEIMGFKSIINEYYARDISKKIRSSFKVRAQKGEFTGTYAPYGYLRDPENKHKLIVDEYAATHVKKMFALAAQGVPAKTIAGIMTNDGILIPRAYSHQRTGKWKNMFNADFPTLWNKGCVQNILKNRVYIGHMVGGKQSIKSFKVKKLENVPEENWITVCNTHEAIISEDEFWHVQKLTSVKNPTNVRKGENVFVGKLRCSSCGRNLAYQNSQGRHKHGSFCCNRYRRSSKLCTSHYIGYPILYDAVLNDIRRLADICGQSEDDFKAYVKQLADDKNGASESHNKKELEKAKARFAELDIIIKRLFEQNALGVIPDDRFAILFGDYTAEQKSLQSVIDALKSQLDKQNSEVENMEMFYGLIKKFTDIEKLTTGVISELIDHIVIYDSDGGTPRRQKVDIFYRHGGLKEIQA